MSPALRFAGAWVLAGIAGCSALDAPSNPVDPRLLDLLEPDPNRPAFERRRARVVVDSEEIAVEATGVAIVSTSGPPRLALQLLPALGSKVLDLRVGADAAATTTLEASWPQADRDVRVAFDGDRGERVLEVLLAASMLEAASPVTPERALAARAFGPGWEIEVDGRLPGVRTVVVVDGAGRPFARRFRYRGVDWSESIDAGVRTLRGRGVAVEVHDESVEGLDGAPKTLFELGAAPPADGPASE